MAAATEHEPVPVVRTISGWNPFAPDDEDEDPPAKPDIHETLQGRWANLLALMFKQHPPQEIPDNNIAKTPSLEESRGEEETQSSCDSDSECSFYLSDFDNEEEETTFVDDITVIHDEEEATLADDNTVNHELNQLHLDLDFTERSIADLELEFAEDLKLLASGLESSFEHFEDQGFFTATLKAQEAMMSQSTRSVFKASVEATLRQNRKKRHTRRQLAMDAAEEKETYQKEQMQAKQEEDHFKTWFDKFWLAIEELFHRFAEQQHQKSPDSEATFFFNSGGKTRATTETASRCQDNA